MYESANLRHSQTPVEKIGWWYLPYLHWSFRYLVPEASINNYARELDWAHWGQQPQRSVTGVKSAKGAKKGERRLGISDPIVAI